MEKLRRRLPPLTGLVIFEAAARLLSFTAAAKEMCITQAAVSRQIRQLEESLGSQLFARSHRTVILTPDGQQLYAAVNQSLERIAQAVTDIRSGASSAITIAATIGFSTFWLIPRLDEFQKKHPDIGVRLLALDREVDLRGENIDLAITCGDEGQTPEIRLTRLMDEVLVPVCSPDYLQGRTLNTPEDLLGERLLNLDRDHWRGFNWPVIDWLHWLEHFDIRATLPMSRLSFNNYAQQLQAALDGRGVSLGCIGMLEDLLAQGRLVRPLPQEYSTHRAYYLAVNEHSTYPAAVETLCAWLLSSATDRGFHVSATSASTHRQNSLPGAT